MIVFKKYIKKPLIALIVAITGLLTLSLFVNINAYQTINPDHDYLPKGLNYFNPDHITYNVSDFDSNEYGLYIPIHINSFKIKKDTSYHLFFNYDETLFSIDDFEIEPYYPYNSDDFSNSNWDSYFLNSFHTNPNDDYATGYIMLVILNEEDYDDYESIINSFEIMIIEKNAFDNNLSNQEYQFLAFEGYDIPVQEQPSIDLLPEGFNYLDPNNFNTVIWPEGTFESQKMFKVKPNTNYTISTFDSSDYFRENNILVEFYDIDKNQIKTANYTMVRDGNYTYTFLTPMNTSYIKLNAFVEFGELQEEFFIDDIYILYEGVKKSNTWLEDLKTNKLHKFLGYATDKTPVLDGETAIVVNVDNPLSLQNIKSRLTALDNEDGDISHLIIVEEDLYTANKNKLGTYQIKFSVKDSADNKTDLIVHVLVKDAVDPVLTGPTSINASPSILKNIEEIKALLTATDNYDSTLIIKVQSNQYQANYNKVGTWPIVFYVDDSSGNRGTHTVNVIVKDDIFPTISGPKTIVKGQTEVLTLSNILEQFTAYDNIDGDIAHLIQIDSDRYTGKGHLVGTYTILFSIKDSSDNKTTHELKITVKDNIPPVFYVDNFFINVSQGLVLTNEDIKNLLIATGQIQTTGITTMTFLVNDYEGNEDQIGIYSMQIQTTSTSGNEKLINLAVKVNEASNNDKPIIITEDTVLKKIFTHVIKNCYWYLGGLIGLYLVKNLLQPTYRKRRRW